MDLIMVRIFINLLKHLYLYLIFNYNTNTHIL